MYLEYIVGPAVALLLGFKLNLKVKDQAKTIESLNEKIVLIEKREEELPKRIMATVMPLAKAVNKLNAQVGL